MKNYNVQHGEKTWHYSNPFHGAGYFRIILQRSLFCLFKHPKYNRRKLKNDIALVRLSTPSTVTPMKIASKHSGSFAGHICTIAGWGQIHCE